MKRLARIVNEKVHRRATRASRAFPKGIRVLVALVILIILLIFSGAAATSNVTLGASWTPTFHYVLHNDISSQSCVVYSGYIYCVGGYSSGFGYQNATYYAPLSPSGGLEGNWNPSTNYPVPIAGQSCVVYSGYIYCVGGFENSQTNAYSTGVYSALLSQSGLGPWTNITSAAYPKRAYYSSCVVDSSYIYCIGGHSSTTSLKDVYYAQLNSSGGITGGWHAATQYVVPVESHSCVVDLGYIYCVGNGAPSPQPHSNGVYYANLTLLRYNQEFAWKNNTVTYPEPVRNESCVVDSHYIYCIGGVLYHHVTPPEFDSTDAVYTALLSSNGAPFTATPISHYNNVSAQSCVVGSPYIYCVGGIRNGSPYLNDVYYDEISYGQTTTIPSPTTSSTTTIPSPTTSSTTTSSKTNPTSTASISTATSSTVCIATTCASTSSNSTSTTCTSTTPCPPPWILQVEVGVPIALVGGVGTFLYLRSRPRLLRCPNCKALMAKEYEVCGKCGKKLRS